MNDKQYTLTDRQYNALIAFCSTIIGDNRLPKQKYKAFGRYFVCEGISTDSFYADLVRRIITERKYSDMDRDDLNSLVSRYKARYPDHKV